MSTTTHSHQKRLARQLSRLPADSPWPVALLAGAIVGGAETSITCARCQDLLPEYVQAEIGEALDLTNPEQARVRRHVLVCPECGWRHAQLLDISWLLVNDRIPQATDRPQPRFPWRKER